MSVVVRTNSGKTQTSTGAFLKQPPTFRRVFRRLNILRQVQCQSISWRYSIQRMLLMRQRRDWKTRAFPHASIRRYRPGEWKAAATEFLLADIDPNNTSTGGGFWAWLLGEQPPPKQTVGYPCDEEWYDRRVQAGNTVLSVMIHEDAQIYRVVTILEAHHPIEIEENTEELAAGSSSAGSEEALVASPSPVMGSDHTPAAAGMRAPRPTLGRNRQRGGNSARGREHRNRQKDYRPRNHASSTLCGGDAR